MVGVMAQKSGTNARISVNNINNLTKVSIMFSMIKNKRDADDEASGSKQASKRRDETKLTKCREQLFYYFKIMTKEKCRAVNEINYSVDSLDQCVTELNKAIDQSERCSSLKPK
jgi:hypothetical protein